MDFYFIINTMAKTIIDITNYKFPINLNYVREINAPGEYQRAFRIQKCKNKGLIVIATCAIEDNRYRWLHVSFSRTNSIPSYDDITFIKEQFL